MHACTRLCTSPWVACMCLQMCMTGRSQRKCAWLGDPTGHVHDWEIPQDMCMTGRSQRKCAWLGDPTGHVHDWMIPKEMCLTGRSHRTCAWLGDPTGHVHDWMIPKEMCLTGRSQRKCAWLGDPKGNVLDWEIPQDMCMTGRSHRTCAWLGDPTGHVHDWEIPQETPRTTITHLLLCFFLFFLCFLDSDLYKHSRLLKAGLQASCPFPTQSCCYPPPLLSPILQLSYHSPQNVTLSLPTLDVSLGERKKEKRERNLSTLNRTKLALHLVLHECIYIYMHVHIYIYTHTHTYIYTHCFLCMLKWLVDYCCKKTQKTVNKRQVLVEHLQVMLVDRRHVYMDKQEHTRRTHEKGQGGRGEGRKGRGDSPDKTQSSPTPGCIAAEAIQYHAATNSRIQL